MGSCGVDVTGSGCVEVAPACEHYSSPSSFPRQFDHETLFI